MKRIISVVAVCIIVLILGVAVFAATSTPVVTPKATTTLSSMPSATPTISPVVSPSKSAEASPTASPSASITPSASSNKDVDISEDSSSLFIDQSDEIKKGNIYFEKWNGKYGIDFPMDDDAVEKVKKSFTTFIAGSFVSQPEVTLTNLLFFIQKTSVELVIKLVDLAFDDKVSFTWLFEGLLTKIIPGMYTSAFKSIISVIIAGIGFYIAFQLFKQDKNKVISIVVKTVLLVALANYFYTNPTEVMKNVDGAVNEISKQIMVGTYVESDDPVQPDLLDGDSVPLKVKNATSADKVPMRNVATAIFREYVHKPWQVLEFGSVKVAEEKMDGQTETNEQRILNAETLAKRNTAYIEIQAKHKFTVNGTKKLAFMVVYMIPVMINIIVLAFLAFLVIAYKFMIVLLIFLGIFIIPLTFIPSIGTDALKSWLMKLFGMSAMKIVLAFFLVLVLSFNNVIYSKANDWGWVVTIFLQSIVYIVVFSKRNEVRDLFGKIQKTMANPSSAKYHMGSYFNKFGRNFDPVEETKGIAKTTKGIFMTGSKVLKPVQKLMQKKDDIGIALGESGALGAEGKAGAKLLKGTKKMQNEVDPNKQDSKKQPNDNNKNSNDNTGSANANSIDTKKSSNNGNKAATKRKETYEDMKERKARQNKSNSNNNQSKVNLDKVLDNKNSQSGIKGVDKKTLAKKPIDGIKDIKK